MNSKSYLSAVAGIDEELIARAERKDETKIMSGNRTEKRMKNMWFKTGIAAACLALVAAVGLGVFLTDSKPQSIDNTPPVQVQEGGRGFTLLLASAAETDGKAVEVKHESEISLPVNGLIMTASVKGLDEDARIDAQENLFRAMQENVNRQGQFHVHGDIVADYAYYTAINSYFLVRADRADMLDSIVIACGENGCFNADISEYMQTKDVAALADSTEITVNADEYAEKYVQTGIALRWGLSDKAIENYAAAEEPSFTDITDTVTATLNYTDGTSETFFIHISFDEAGNMLASYTETN